MMLVAEHQRSLVQPAVAPPVDEFDAGVVKEARRRQRRHRAAAGAVLIAAATAVGLALSSWMKQLVARSEPVGCASENVRLPGRPEPPTPPPTSSQRYTTTSDLTSIGATGVNLAASQAPPE